MIPRALVAVFLAGCGCAEGGYGARDADVAKNNQRAAADAVERAGWTPVQVEMLEKDNPYVTQPTVRDSAGKIELVFPSSREPPLVVRERSGKIFWVDMKHEVKETRTGRVCGCGPGATGTAPPMPPAWSVPLVTKEDYGGAMTLVARGWIDVAYSYPESGERRCHEIP